MPVLTITIDKLSEEIMDIFYYDAIAPAIDDYIGDDLTWEDLQRGYTAFLEDRER